MHIRIDCIEVIFTYRMITCGSSKGTSTPKATRRNIMFMLLVPGTCFWMLPKVYLSSTLFTVATTKVPISFLFPYSAVKIKGNIETLVNIFGFSTVFLSVWTRCYLFLKLETCVVKPSHRYRKHQRKLI